MDELLTKLQDELLPLWEEALDIWTGGGWAMIAIAGIALFLFLLGGNMWLRLFDKGFGRVPERTWRRWIDHPAERRGPIGELLDFVTGTGSLETMELAFERLQSTETRPFQRDLKVMKICVSAAPLVGLLGTVTGMLTTFDALSLGAGGDKTMGMVADGISTALITTETGLVVALPGLFFQYQLARKAEAYKAFLAHLESVCTQQLYRRIRNSQRRSQAAA